MPKQAPGSKLSKRSCHATMARLAPELDIQKSAAWIFHDSWVFHTWRMRLPASLFFLPENLGGNQILGKMAMEIVHQDENAVETRWVRNSHWETIGSKLPCLLSGRHPSSWTRSHHVWCQSWLSIGHGHFWMEMYFKIRSCFSEQWRDRGDQPPKPSATLKFAMQNGPFNSMIYLLFWQRCSVANCNSHYQAVLLPWL